jgi:ubiquitin carboxyl-terminal hydrolase 1
MGTRCLECETSTYRSETFTNIDIPLTFDDEEETLSVKDLFLREIMASETLRENNKYWCAECSRLNEAQRSVQYEVLPRIMVLQLKRFTATGNKNYMSKINDYIPTPLSMNCFCTECLQAGGKEQPKHHYRLYAVIMHLGATLASGHYIAYVRASDSTGDYLNCQRNSTVERKNKKGILKYFSRSSDGGRSSVGSGSNSSILTSTNGVSSSNSGSESNVCRSLNCCGIRTLGQLSVTPESSGLNSLPPIGSSSSISGERNSIVHHHGQYSQKMMDNKDLSNDLMVMMSNGIGNSTSSNQKSGSIGSGSFSSSSSSTDIEDVWLECDDDSISVITRKQFEEELSSKQSATTPYLLFYQRI